MFLLLSYHYNPTYSHTITAARSSQQYGCASKAETLCGAHSAVYIMVCEVPSPMLKRPGREADHSPLSGVEVKNEWSCNSTLPIRRHSMNRSKFILGLCSFQSFHSRRVSSAPQSTAPNIPPQNIIFSLHPLYLGSQFYLTTSRCHFLSTLLLY